MSQLLRGLPSLLLLFVLFKLIVCGNHELPKSRRERSSYMDTSQYITEHFSGIVEHKRNVHRSSQLLQEQPPYQYKEHEQTYPSYPPRHPPRYPPFLPQYPPPHARVSYSNRYHQQYANFRQTHKPHYQRELEPRRSSSTSIDDNLLTIFESIFTQPTLHRHPIGPPKRAQSNGDDSRYGVLCTSRTKSLCMNVSNYPEPRELEVLFRENNIGKYEAFFKEDSLPLRNITQPMNGDFDDEELCNSTTEVVYPKAGQSKDANWFFIVNTEEIRQRVVIQICDREDEPCNSYIETPNVYQTVCRQQYIFHKMVAISSDKKKITLEAVRLPSCCSCVVQAHPTSAPKRAQSSEDDSRYGVLCTSLSKSLCMNVSNYPEPRKLEALFRENNIGKYEAFFRKDSLPLLNITQPINSDFDDEDLCKSTTEVVYPQAGQSEDSNWFFIVNTDEFRQGVVIHKCDRTNESCNGPVTPKVGYQTVCKQHYTSETMVVFTIDCKKMTLEEIMIPSCCSCVAKKRGLY